MWSSNEPSSTIYRWDWRSPIDSESMAITDPLITIKCLNFISYDLNFSRCIGWSTRLIDFPLILLLWLKMRESSNKIKSLRKLLKSNSWKSCRWSSSWSLSNLYMSSWYILYLFNSSGWISSCHHLLADT